MAKFRLSLRDHSFRILGDSLRHKTVLGQFCHRYFILSLVFRLPENMLEWGASFDLVSGIFYEMPTTLFMEQETVKMYITRKKE